LLNFLGSAQAEKQVGEGEARRIVNALGFGAFFTKVHLLHFVTYNLGEMHGGFLVLANAAQHKFSSRISAHRTL
jgi:hypothetical protein